MEADLPTPAAKRSREPEEGEPSKAPGEGEANKVQKLTACTAQTDTPAARVAPSTTPPGASTAPPTAPSPPWSGPSMEETRRSLRAFAQARDWDQFHTPRNLAL